MSRKDPATTVAYHKRYYEENKAKWQTPEARTRANERSRNRTPEERARLWLQWYSKNRVDVLAKQRAERLRDPEGHRARRREFWRNNPDQYRKAQRDWGARLRAEMIAAYGNACACCGETAHAFLALDHINRDGKAHRLALRKSTDNTRGGRTRDVYADLKRRGWPKDNYRLCCVNCNFATRYGDPCPHEMEALVGVVECGRT